MDLAVRRIKNSAHLVLAFTAFHVQKKPSNGLTVIGVTGTDGKTTTASLIYHILKKAGKKAAVISTVGAYIDDEKYETGFHVTTPSPFTIQRYIRLARVKGCTHIVLEVTSHALDQNRVWGIHFNIGVLTNITHEHLDYHQSYERYVSTKLKLLKKSDLAIANSNGEWIVQVKSAIPAKKLITYSLHGKENEDITLMNLPFKIKTDMMGDFNMENILAASITSLRLGIDPKVIDSAIQSFKLPEGRQETLKTKKGTLVMIDFAHTPNSLERILPEIRKRTTGRLIHVFGSAGERDSRKRPEMGRAASFYDDVIILTAEDPRSETVKEINLDIKKGIKNKDVLEIENRYEAIRHALKSAEKNDTVIITGKGHEKSMNMGHGEEKWNDREAVLKVLDEL